MLVRKNFRNMLGHWMVDASHSIILVRFCAYSLCFISPFSREGASNVLAHLSSILIPKVMCFIGVGETGGRALDVYGTV